MRTITAVVVLATVASLLACLLAAVFAGVLAAWAGDAMPIVLRRAGIAFGGTLALCIAVAGLWISA